MAKKKSKKQLPSDMAETANRIWLAGLGALATAEEEGTKAFKKLVERGKSLEGESRDRVKDGVDKARNVAESAWDGLASSLDDRVSDAMHRLGVPTRDEIQTLSARVEALTKKVEAMKSTAPAKSTATTKAPAKKTATRPASSKSASSKSASSKSTSGKTSSRKAPAKKSASTKTGASKTSSKKAGATKAETNEKLKES